MLPLKQFQCSSVGLTDDCPYLGIFLRSPYPVHFILCVIMTYMVICMQKILDFFYILCLCPAFKGNNGPSKTLVVVFSGSLSESSETPLDGNFQ